MASILYREGKGHMVDGVECEVAYVEIDQLEAHLSSGWSATPPGAATEEKPSADDEVRQAAKAAGIDGWDTKRIATLRKALDSK